MIVDQDESVSGMGDNGFEDFARVSDSLVESADGNANLLEQPESSIE